MKSKILVLVAVLFAAASFSGCASTGGSQTQLLAKAAVQYAVFKVSEKSPEKAARILVISHSVREIAGKDGFNTVDLLVDAIRIRANVASLSPADQMLANLLIDAVGSELKARIGTGTLSTDKLLIVGEVAGWIEDAAKIAAPVAK
jgi:hypothetical protein